MVAHFTSLQSAVKVLGERIQALHHILAEMHAGAAPPKALGLSSAQLAALLVVARWPSICPSASSHTGHPLPMHSDL